MSGIKLIALDLDGTFLNSALKVRESYETKGDGMRVTATPKLTPERAPVP